MTRKWTPTLRPWRTADGSVNRPLYYTFLFSLMLFSGTYSLLADSWTPFFRLNLLLHPVLGVWITVSLVRALFGRLRAVAPGLTYPIALAFVAVIFLALLRSFTLKHLPIKESNQIAGAIFFVLIFVATYLLAKGIPLLRSIGNRRAAWLDISTISLWSLSAAVGLAILIYGGGRDSKMLFDFHAFISYVAAIAGLIALIRPVWREFWRSRVWLAPPYAAVTLALLALAVNTASGWLDPVPSLPQTTLHLSTLPYEARAPQERDAAAGPFSMSADWLEIVDGCGGSGCHSALIADHRHSVHNNAFKTPHVAKVLTLLHDEIGFDNERMCYGCHIPSAFYEPAATAADFSSRDNMGCTFCHSIAAVERFDSERSALQVEVNAHHLWPFVAAERAGRPVDDFELWLIRLNPGAHGRALTKKFYREDEFCMGCHQLQLEPGSSPQSCNDCHMEQRQAFGFADEAKSRNHLFLGSNTTIPELLGMYELAATTEAWLQGKFLLRTLLDLYEHERDGPRPLGADRLPNYLYMTMGSAFDVAPVGGQAATLRIRTDNVNLGHGFPSSSLDLQQTWLHVKITDKTGRIIYESGAETEDGGVDPDARTLGGYLLAETGEKITHYRVWLPHRAVIERQIPDRGYVEDVYTFDVPPDVHGWLNVEARWRYRKLNQEFWEWAYGLDLPIPTVTVVEHFTQVAVTSQ